ncbi:hypothetical protein O9992_20485 [Vibrio lentus]|nr:hypothetical protein [Vibrio lentus]
MVDHFNWRKDWGITRRRRLSKSVSKLDKLHSMGCDGIQGYLSILVHFAQKPSSSNINALSV